MNKCDGKMCPVCTSERDGLKNELATANQAIELFQSRIKLLEAVADAAKNVIANQDAWGDCKATAWSSCKQLEQAVTDLDSDANG